MNELLQVQVQIAAEQTKKPVGDDEKSVLCVDRRSWWEKPAAFVSLRP